MVWTDFYWLQNWRRLQKWSRRHPTWKPLYADAGAMVHSLHGPSGLRLVSPFTFSSDRCTNSFGPQLDPKSHSKTMSPLCKNQSACHEFCMCGWVHQVSSGASRVLPSVEGVNPGLVAEQIAYYGSPRSLPYSLSKTHKVLLFRVYFTAPSQTLGSSRCPKHWYFVYTWNTPEHTDRVYNDALLDAPCVYPAYRPGTQWSTAHFALHRDTGGQGTAKAVFSKLLFVGQNRCHRPLQPRSSRGRDTISRVFHVGDVNVNYRLQLQLFWRWLQVFMLCHCKGFFLLTAKKLLSMCKPFQTKNRTETNKEQLLETPFYAGLSRWK